MNEFARIAVAASALLLATGAAAQMNKCANAAGKITYTSLPCGDLGLKGAGEVKDKMNSAPGEKFTARPVRPEPAPGAASPNEAERVKAEGDSGAAAAKADEDRRCFSVKAGKGTSTRCNDKPDG